MSDPGAKNAPALKRLLAEVRDRAPETMDEALTILQGAHTVQAAIHLQLQGALGLIRAGRPEEAVPLIWRAIGMGQRWAGVLGVCAGPSSVVSE